MNSSVDTNVLAGLTSNNHVVASGRRGCGLSRISREEFASQRCQRRLLSLAWRLLLVIATPSPMLSRTVACVLILLVVAPFTAPFPTCDLMALVGAAHPAQAAASTAEPMRSRRAPNRRLRGDGKVSGRATVEAAVAERSGPAPHPWRSTARTDDVTVPGLLIASTLGRPRLPHLARALTWSTATGREALTTAGVDDRSIAPTVPTRQISVLRV
jgi:hypothetical protein